MPARSPKLDTLLTGEALTLHTFVLNKKSIQQRLALVEQKGFLRRDTSRLFNHLMGDDTIGPFFQKSGAPLQIQHPSQPQPLQALDMLKPHHGHYSPKQPSWVLHFEPTQWFTTLPLIKLGKTMGRLHNCGDGSIDRGSIQRLLMVLRVAQVEHNEHQKCSAESCEAVPWHRHRKWHS